MLLSTQGQNARNRNTFTSTAWTLPTLMLLSGLKGAENQLLPASFRAMELDLHLAPAQLGILALCQGLSCVITGPFWGNLVDSGVSRKLILKFGVALWGCASILLAYTSSFRCMAFLRVVTGAGIAMLSPVEQSLVADMTDKTELGQLFGKITMSFKIGQLIVSFIVVPIASKTVLGMAGWRLMLAIVGVICLCTIGLIERSFYDSGNWDPNHFGITKEMKKLVRFFQIETFRVIILQGMFGTIPGAASSFVIMYFQYSGISNQMIAVMMCIRLIGDAIGSALGGYLGDQAHKSSPKYGRVCIALWSVGLGIPFTILAYWVLTPSADLSLVYAGIWFLQGMMTTWEVSGCINPVLVEIMPRRFLSSACAWNVALVFASGNSIGPMLVGWLAQDVFHYESSTLSFRRMDAVVREQNAHALGQAIFFSCLIPSLIALLSFLLMLSTYPADKQCKEKTDSEDSENSPCSPYEAAATTKQLKGIM